MTSVISTILLRTRRSNYDEVTCSACSGGVARWATIAADLCKQVFSPGLHLGSIVCDIGFAKILPHRLSRSGNDRFGMERVAASLGTDQGSELFDVVACRAKTPGKRGFQRLLTACCHRGRDRGLIVDDAGNTAAIDATGLETRHVSLHYQRKCDRGHSTHATWPKLTAVFHASSQLIAGAVVGLGPSQDSPDFTPAMRQAAGNLRPVRVLADKGYDAEHNHALCRRELGIRSTAIPINRRNAKGPPLGHYRRMMHDRFPLRQYRQRAQAESGFSRHKRRLGSALTARSQATQHNELLLRTLTHNLMILANEQ